MCVRTKEYEHAKVAIDAVLFTIRGSMLHVLLRQREKEPYTGRYELIAGFLLPGETAEETLARKLKETIGKEPIFFQQFHTFTQPLRDPRGRVASIGFMALINEQRAQHLDGWHDVEKLPALAFDHKEIITKARLYLKQNINEVMAQHFLPDRFPLNKLQEAYEIIEGEVYDNRNFRKKMITSDIVEETKDWEENVSHRPARLYRFRR